MLTVVKLPIKLKSTLGGTGSASLAASTGPAVTVLPHREKRRASSLEREKEEREAGSSQGAVRYQ